MIDGDPNAPIMIVAMAPGEEELKANSPLVGASGRLLWPLAKRAGFGREDCYIVNTIGEWPEGQGGKSPSRAQYEKYWDQFNSAVAAFKGRIVIVLGGDAFKRFSGIGYIKSTSGRGHRDGIEAWRGYLVDPSECRPLERTREIWGEYKTSRKGKYKKGDPKLIKIKVKEDPVLPENLDWICPTLHPAGVLRSGRTTTPALAADLSRAWRLHLGAMRQSRLAYSEGPETLHGMVVAFDIETIPETDAIERIGLGDETRTWTAAWTPHVRDITDATLSDPKSVKIAHNLAFDLPRLQKAGVTISPPYFDTMLAAAMLQPDLYKGLEPVAALYLDRQRWKHLSDEDPAFYNAQDVNATLELYPVLRGELARNDQLDLFEKSIMPAVPVFARMTTRGIKMHPQRRDEWINRLRDDLDLKLKRWQFVSGGINPNAPQQISKYLYDTLGMPVQYNKYGGITSDEGALQGLMMDYPQHREKIELLLDVKGIGKDLSVYAETAFSVDGCVHPSFLPANKDDDRFDPDGLKLGKGLAGTWRPTAKNPNIQNQTGAARLLYVPHQEGMFIVEYDYNQIEARVLAALSGDGALAEALELGLHEEIMKILGVDRTRAKNAFYGWSYGAGATTLRRTFRARGYDISFAECKELLGRLDRRFEHAVLWRQRIMAEVEQSFVVTNPFGLKRYFYKRGIGPAAANAPIQSTPAIILWKLMPKLDEAVTKLGGALLAVVHDSVVCELPEGADLTVVRDIMQQEWPEVAPGFRVPVKVKAGPSWGETKEIE